ncbi:UDP-N-acetylmuramyl pentapeptide phosphotransferase/UDP-N-acetylglucosamine-1-phosphate transferase [Fervidobacterium pennivorans DSM 9078]|uniref:UDP-N-acetylmuramyl pentapeptide phosphotransferase/UDP-N-acetylglucosamine-1-phosphate transferase n=1 Tax=Fervidobacterium pennivorans (strain DSM 9078 / Ven5) TaxID=771875 RepID=H9UA52_FERPD|nr:MraY family glycosyltransferase [Fervidobacterium pennivorans]AFG34395.1 UDP-N-acetylmuramyl pentapeptide phosphotransferase/UDP-N-acetylglucosamine-1-phosphate transferase [Fervidobacterium pennivorans DSM 9078]QIV77741.1 undecaprenyl/decaprenyl-phosphate alpha-N-acetylglucosaminyl 1-phosphate transferase [Fervidobacterium pennivorans subsp. keratinolyticus]
MQSASTKDLWIILASFIISALTIPIFGRLAYRYGIVDKPDGELKPHERITPYLGGLSIYLGVLFVTPFEFVTKIALTVLVLLGLYDDAKNSDPNVRLITEFVIASVLVYKYVGLSLLFPLYAVLIVALVNAVNMMDGLDGVCASVSAISAIGLFIVATSRYDKVLLLSLVGALFGYLLYNFPPARIFMGDAGSYLIGGVLSVGLLSSIRNGSSNLPYVVSAFIFLSLFFFDLGAGVLRRVLNGRSPFSGDRGHFYDKIQSKTENKRYTLFVVVFIQFALFTIGMIAKQNAMLSLLAVLMLLVMYYFISKWLKILKY